MPPIDVTEQPADLVHVCVIQYANDLRTGTLVYREERIERVVRGFLCNWHFQTVDDRRVLGGRRHSGSCEFQLISSLLSSVSMAVAAAAND